MKFLIFLTLIICSFGLNAQNKSPQNPVLKTKMDSVSYALGFALSGILKSEVGLNDSSGLDYDIMKIVIQRSLAGDSLLMNEAGVRMILSVLQSEQMARQENEKSNKNAPIIAGNEIKAAEFLEKNKKAEGVITTQSGLQYKIIKSGKGKKPKDSQTVKVHYTGKFLDGRVFDSSVDRGEPSVFGVNQVIPGWVEVLQLMPVGSKWEVYIPADLGYGAQGNYSIPGGSLLIFEIELLGIEK